MGLALVTLVAALALGIAGRASDYGPADVTFLFALGSPWVLAAFAVGACARRPRDGAVAGAAALSLSVAVYYALMYTVEQRAGEDYAAAMTILWGGLGLACGALFGTAGSLLRSRDVRRRGLAAAVLGGTLAGEALLFLLLGRPHPEILTVQLAVGCLIPLLAAGAPRRVPPVAAATAAVALAALVADASLRVLARMGGWGGV
jgi:hypothetical protein